MHIVQVAAELAPVAKVGGLGDVVLGLSRELQRQGSRVEVIIPKYDIIEYEGVDDLAVIDDTLTTTYDGKVYSNTVWSGRVLGVPVFFIEPHHPADFFQRGCFYACPDDIDRFLYFSLAALDFIQRRGALPDIIHNHDWHTAVLGPLCRCLCPRRHQPAAPCPTRLVFTVHNVQYQGLCSAHDLEKVGLNSSKLPTTNDLFDDHRPGIVNLVKGGIAYADFITTVSPRHAHEVMTTEGGLGLDATFRQYRDKFIGILNGLDYGYWNPATDPYLPANFSSSTDDKDGNPLSNKGLCKEALRQRTKLADGHRPIVACIARLVPQKGIELIKHAIDHTVALGGQFVLLGSSPIPEIDKEFHRILEATADNPHVFLILQHFEDLAHLIFAGSDMFIVPSVFEPCGLTQLIALRHGTIPIVRHTGGLADTIVDVDDPAHPFEKSNGFVFDDLETQSFDGAIDRAFKLWFQQPEKWRQLVINGMNMDFSWKESAKQYLDVYRKTLQTPRQRDKKEVRKTKKEEERETRQGTSGSALARLALAPSLQKTPHFAGVTPLS